MSSRFLKPKDLLDLLDLVPESAWEDREGKPYVPARYGACFWDTKGPPDAEAALDMLPASARALLRGSNRNHRCLVVTPEEARSLEEIMSQARPYLGAGLTDGGVWSLRNGNQVGISLRPLFPDGSKFFAPGF